MSGHFADLCAQRADFVLDCRVLVAETPDRLDSWKAIAEYLGRDERTLRRWERQGLPVRRVAGSAGHSVFAYKSEINQWLKAGRPTGNGVTPAAEPSPEPSRVRFAPRLRFVAAALIVMAGIVSVQMLAPSATEQPVRATLSSSGLVALNAARTELWRYDFPPDWTTALSISSAEPAVVTSRAPEGVYAVTAYEVRRADSIQFGGALRHFTLSGRLLHTFGLNDRWSFSDGRSYEEPWALTDFRINDHYGRRIALAAHHIDWWPSVVTVLDDRWVRSGTFVNSGWVETIRWLSPDRLAIGGFSNSRDGGMLAVLDANNLDGSSPEDPAGRFHCQNCKAGGPLFYAVFPRSELNRVTGSGFNRAWLNTIENRLVIRTAEVDRNGDIGPLSDAIYEFSMSLDLLAASYSDRYWDDHRRLEQEGRLRHSRAECPYRDGPPAIDVWTPDAGWQRMASPEAVPRAGIGPDWQARPPRPDPPRQTPVIR